MNKNTLYEKILEIYYVDDMKDGMTLDNKTKISVLKKKDTPLHLITLGKYYEGIQLTGKGYIAPSLNPEKDNNNYIVQELLTGINNHIELFNGTVPILVSNEKWIPAIKKLSANFCTKIEYLDRDN